MRLEGSLLRSQGHPQLQYRGPVWKKHEGRTREGAGQGRGFPNGYQARSRPQVGLRPRLGLPAPARPFFRLLGQVGGPGSRKEEWEDEGQHLHKTTGNSLLGWL